MNLKRRDQTANNANYANDSETLGQTRRSAPTRADIPAQALGTVIPAQVGIQY